MRHWSNNDSSALIKHENAINNNLDDFKSSNNKTTSKIDKLNWIINYHNFIKQGKDNNKDSISKIEFSKINKE